MRLKLFYIPNTKAIVARVKGEFYQLPNCNLIEKPIKFYPCQPFVEQASTSEPYEIINAQSYEWINELSIKTSNNDTEVYIRAGKPQMILRVNYSKNGDNKDILTISGSLPLYVLNGVAKLLTAIPF
jgi:hypothetical protein